MTRVLVVAPSAVVRAGLETILQSSPDIEVVGASPAGPSLARQVEALRPDVVLLEGDGNVVPDLPALGPRESPPALVLLAEGNGDDLAQSLRAGARAILPRDAGPEEIVAAVGAAAVGLLVLHLDHSDVLLPLLAPRAEVPEMQEPLTPREMEVLQMLAEGAGNKLVARQLGISEHTVKFHVGSILAKLNAASRTEAVTTGIRQGMIML